MKNRYSIYLSILLLVAASSCQKGFLDQVPDDRLTIDDIFTSKNTTLDYLADVYSSIPDEAYQRFAAGSNAGLWTGGSDEAKYTWDFVNSNDINLGSWDPTENTGFVRSYWTNYYQGIRNAGYFIAHVDECPELSSTEKIQYSAEARALRAMYYYYLIRIYGPVVITGDDVIAPDASLEDVQLPRNTFDECVDYIVSELDKAAANLPKTTSNSSQYGRITQGIARAFKIETLLLSASPLFNGNTDYADLKNPDGTQLINQTYDANKWKLAADAAKSFITEFVPSVYGLYKKNDENGTFSPYLSCRDVMLTDWNSEWIFARTSASITVMQYDRTPYHANEPSENKGGGGLGVTQGMVDAYFMDNGMSPYNSDGTVNTASGFETSGFTSFQAPGDNAARSTYNQWVNREARFYVGVTYDGSHWLNTNSADIVTSTQKSGNSGVTNSGSDHSPTGYICRKNVSLGAWSSGSRSLVLIRLAEIYLDYAEALNESDPGNADIRIYLNLIRDRAGIPLYGEGENALDLPATQEEMREAIRKERRVELAFENVRYFDTRRWKIAEQTDAGATYGLNINADAPDFYKVVSFETRVFEKKHYLFPIPQNELDIDKQMVQNTGW